MKQQLLDRRLRGELPIIKIDGDDYIIDWRLKELRCKNDMARVIDLNRLDLNLEGTEYTGLYDKETKQVIYSNPDNMDKNIAVLHIPYELVLDPVGVAREHKMEDTALLDRFPIKESLIAKLETLQDFQTRLKEQYQKKTSGKTPNTRKRKGKHL